MKQKIGRWKNNNVIYLHKGDKNQHWTIEDEDGEVVHKFRDAEEISKWIYHNWYDPETGTKRIEFYNEGRNKSYNNKNKSSGNDREGRSDE